MNAERARLRARLDGPTTRKSHTLAVAGPTLRRLLDGLDALDAAEARIARVTELLTANGCWCGCDHSHYEHDDSCIRCLPCRIEAALANPERKEPTNGK